MLLLLLPGLPLLISSPDDLLEPWGHFVSRALHVLRDHVPVPEVLDVFLQDEALQALEREAELLVEGEALERLEVLVHRPLHQFVHFPLEDLLRLQKELPVAQHQDGDVLSWEGRLIEEDLERRVREPTLDLLPQCEVIEFQADWEKVTYLLHIDLMLLPFYCKELIQDLLSIVDLLLRPDEHHLSEVVRKIEEWVPELLPVPAHPLYPYLARVNLDLYFFNMFHDDLAVVHLKKHGLHLEVLELPLHQVIHHADIAGCPEHPQLCGLIHGVHIVAHEVAAEIEIDRVEFPIVRQVFFLVANELADEVARDRDENDLEGVVQDGLMVGRDSGQMVPPCLLACQDV